MKKAAIAIGSLILLLSIILSGMIYYNISHQGDYEPADQTENINVMLTRAEDWHKVVDTEVITLKDMAMIDGSTATIPITAELLRQFWNYTDMQVEDSGIIYHSTTHIAYENLIDKEYTYFYEDEKSTYDLIFVTSPSEYEKETAKKKNIELDMTPIAKDGFVFITHKDNPVDSLTVEQIQDIYAGKITNWKQVGGEDLKIAAYQREPNSGSQTAMEEMVMKGEKMIKPIETEIYYAMGGLIDAVAEYKNGKSSIGYTYYYYINNLYKNDNIKVLKVNDIAPDNEHLINESYPFTTSYYAVMRGNEPKDSPARKLRDFLVTEEGQQVIEMAGYCRSMMKVE